MPETIFTAAFNAAKKPPEWLGKKTVDLYDKLRFPKLTKEEQKVNDKLHVFLKKHYKAVGWVETGIGASLVTLGVVKVYQALRNRKGMTRENGNKNMYDTMTHPVSRPDTGGVVVSGDLILQKKVDLQAVREYFVQFAVHDCMQDIHLPRGKFEEGDLDLLRAIDFSDDLNRKIANGYFHLGLNAILERKRNINAALTVGGQLDQVKNALGEAKARFLSAQEDGVAQFLSNAVKPDSVQSDVLNMIDIFRRWFLKNIDISEFAKMGIEKKKY